MGWRCVARDWSYWMVGARHDGTGPMVLLGPWSFSSQHRPRHVEADEHSSEGYIVFFASSTLGLFMQFEPRSALFGVSIHNAGVSLALGQVRLVFAHYEITGNDVPLALFRRPRWMRLS